jgi:DNA-binding MarR family transcriptional regulator
MPRDIIRFSYLYDVLVALGSSRGYELPLSTLASVTGLSPATLEDYLRPYVEEEPKLFKRVVRSGRLGGRRVFYRLADSGLKVYHRLPEYVKYGG